MSIPWFYYLSSIILIESIRNQDRNESLVFYSVSILIMLGEVIDDTIEVVNSYAVPFEEDPSQRNI